MERERLAENIDAVRAAIADACARAGRDPSSVTLVAVTKYLTPEQAALLPELGLLDLGENRVQELLKKRERLPASVRWHMIGHLQRNKVKKVLPAVVLVHGVDSVRLLDALAGHASPSSPAPLLLEVNLSGEETKYGFAPGEVETALEHALGLPSLRPLGLMTMAPVVDDAEKTRPIFAALRELRDSLARRFGLGDSFRHLSMGMSQDYEVAVEEGATLVRVGSVLYRGAL
ncbi:MAG: YggS family pyridoxal phosphate-dependent enzyme [Planctomycetota bacterium]|nr:MAG: YggS family pyridoxal phosphate-dependent enzyme [Planctomycetota bacterium]